MIVHDLNIAGIAVSPREAYAPLCIDPYAVLAGKMPTVYTLTPISRGSIVSNSRASDRIT